MFKRGCALSSPGALALHCRSDSMFLVKSSAEKSASLQPPAFCVERGHGDGPVTRTRGWRDWVLGAQTHLQQVAPARLVGERKRRRPLEGVRVFSNRGWVVSRYDGKARGFECARTAVLVVLGALVLLSGLAKSLALRTRKRCKIRSQRSVKLVLDQKLKETALIFLYMVSI